MTGRRGTVVVRRSAAVAAGLALCGWLSTLAPAPPAAFAARTAERPPQTAVVNGSGAATGAKAGRSPQPTSPRPSAGASPSPSHPPAPAVDCKRMKCVALTFDDGPMGVTAKLLDTLAASKVRATFFLVGRNVEEYPQLVRREAAEGHELANHSFSHSDLGRSSTAKVTSELMRTQQAIHRVAGVTPTLMRPPYGSTDKQVAAVTKRLGLAQVLWTVDPLDWQVRNTKKVQRKVIGGTGNGHIVLMHDIHPTTVAAVPHIIDRLAAKGYVFVTVSQLYGKPLAPGKEYTEREPVPEKKAAEERPSDTEQGDTEP
ncbi:hypothetical protein GCM10010191_24060 [Actinomadura vinacea]|uniref:NodB homology domain-containing protein n=1 Tax=Actinomadura vinacea TaxID=115336 RepID=A0ABN3ITY0_9ACTN